MTNNLLFLSLVGITVAAASAYLGSFMVLKRMSLVGDALSHVALPGMAIALLIGISPMIGAFVALAIAIVAIWYISEKSEVYPEALVGVFFTVSLAIGLLVTPEPELFEALFGNLQKITTLEGIGAVILSVMVILLTFFISKKLMIGIISEDLAKSVNVKTKLVNLVYLLMIGIVVALGVRFVGTLLTGALVIIPAVAAKNIAKNIMSFHILSICFGILSALVGIVCATLFSLPSGPIVVIASTLIFILSFVVHKYSQ